MIPVQRMQFGTMNTFHHGFYEERYKILKAVNDTLIVRMSEYLFHTEENGKAVSSSYNDGNPVFIFIREK